jgi:hypothetical protein
MNKHSFERNNKSYENIKAIMKDSARLLKINKVVDMPKPPPSVKRNLDLKFDFNKK